MNSLFKAKRLFPISLNMLAIGGSTYYLQSKIAYNLEEQEARLEDGGAVREERQRRERKEVIHDRGTTGKMVTSEDGRVLEKLFAASPTSTCTIMLK
jgi:hypothetical protein